jgi:hypothetical protein
MKKMKKLVLFVTMIAFVMAQLPVFATQTDVVHSISGESTVINAQDYCETTGTIEESTECWAGASGKINGKFIKNPEDEVWTATYKINVAEDNAGLYNLSLKCYHWGSVSLEVYVDEVKINTVNPSKAAVDGALPAINVDTVRLSNGEHTIMVSGSNKSKGYFFEQFMRSLTAGLFLW